VRLLGQEIAALRVGGGGRGGGGALIEVLALKSFSFLYSPGISLSYFSREKAISLSFFSSPLIFLPPPLSLPTSSSSFPSRVLHPVLSPVSLLLFSPKSNGVAHIEPTLF
jgi:hypothetical protein